MVKIQTMKEWEVKERGVRVILLKIRAMEGWGRRGNWVYNLPGRLNVWVSALVKIQAIEGVEKEGAECPTYLAG